MEAIKGHIIGQGSLVAIYERKPIARRRRILTDPAHRFV